MKNVIILGAGRTGSSFLSGLISRNRFYINREMINSRASYPDGDYENPELIELNKRILLESGYGYDKAYAEKQMHPALIKELESYSTDPAFKDFVAKCEENSPWLWKDPRLCYTIPFWKHLIDLSGINFIKITRNPYLVFKSHSKFQIKHLKRDLYNNYHWQTQAVDQFLSENHIKALEIDFSELKDLSIIDKLNSFLSTHITREDYKVVRKDNISKKESPAKFMFRYAIGACKLHLKKYFRKVE